MRHSSRRLERRLSIIEGQIRGIRRMTRNGESSANILQQIGAARGGLTTLGELAVTRDCEVRIHQVEPESRVHHADEMTDLLKVYRRLIES